MAITRDKLLVVARELLTALKDLADQADIPESAPVFQRAEQAIERAEKLIGEEIT